MDQTPVAEAVAVSATLRGEEEIPVAVVQLFDIARDTRVVQLTEAACYDAIEGLTQFLSQLHKARRAEARRG